jgi:hypothetical protein
MPSSNKEASKAPVRVSVSCLAELIKLPNRSADSIARLLRPFKFNKRGEGFARSAYYKPTLTAIRSYHSNGNDVKIFDAAIIELRNKATKTDDKLEKVKSEKNIDAIAAYRTIYGKRRFRVLTNHRIGYLVGKVVFTPQPLEDWNHKETAFVRGYSPHGNSEGSSRQRIYRRESKERRLSERHDGKRDDLRGRLDKIQSHLCFHRPSHRSRME